MEVSGQLYAEREKGRIFEDAGEKSRREVRRRRGEERRELCCQKTRPTGKSSMKVKTLEWLDEVRHQ
jgi:hypothetical protein